MGTPRKLAELTKFVLVCDRCKGLYNQGKIELKEIAPGVGFCRHVVEGLLEFRRY